MGVSCITSGKGGGSGELGGGATDGNIVRMMGNSQVLRYFYASMRRLFHKILGSSIVGRRYFGFRVCRGGQVLSLWSTFT